MLLKRKTAKSTNNYFVILSLLQHITRLLKEAQDSFCEEKQNKAND